VACDIHIVNAFNPLIGWGSEFGSLYIANILKELKGCERIVFHGTPLGPEQRTKEELGADEIIKTYRLGKALKEKVRPGDIVLISQTSMLPHLHKVFNELSNKSTVIGMDQAPFTYRPHQPDGTLRDKVSRLAARLIFSRLSRDIPLIVFSDKQAEILSDVGFKVYREELPVKIEREPLIREKPDRFKIVYMNRIDQDKGPILFVKSLSEFLRFPEVSPAEVEIHIIGSGLLERLLKLQLNRLINKIRKNKGNAPIVVFHGYKKEERFNELEDAHLKMVTSRMESALNLAAREALYFGVPVLYPDLPVLREESKRVYSELGVNFVDRNPKTYAKQMKNYYILWRSDPRGYNQRREEISRRAHDFFSQAEKILRKDLKAIIA